MSLSIANKPEFQANHFGSASLITMYGACVVSNNYIDTMINDPCLTSASYSITIWEAS